MACGAPQGYALNDTDCDDTRAAVNPAAVEICNGAMADGGVDENCNGLYDEDCPCTPVDSTEACGSAVAQAGLGLCQAGTRTCGAAGWGPCVDVVEPTGETCDGQDGDCDGIADDSDTDIETLGDVCGSNVGECTTGTIQCNGAMLGCSGVPPANETCDHRDNDCDRRFDDGASQSAACQIDLTPNDATDVLTNTLDTRVGRYNTLGSSDEIELSWWPGGTLGDAGAVFFSETSDWGFNDEVEATFDLRAWGDAIIPAGGRIGVVVSPSANLNSGGVELPVLSGAQRGYAALYFANPLAQRIEIWEISAGGAERVAQGGQALDCLIPRAETTGGATQTYVVRLRNSGSLLTATVRGCGNTQSVSYRVNDFETAVYGVGSGYPRYLTGAHARIAGDTVRVELTRMRAWRRPQTNGGHCVACEW